MVMQLARAQSTSNKERSNPQSMEGRGRGGDVGGVRTCSVKIQVALRNIVSNGGGECLHRKPMPWVPICTWEGLG